MTASSNFAAAAADDVARRVRLFLQQRRVAPASPLIVETHEGVVTVRGTVATFHERQIVVSTIQRVAGVLQIVDELLVNPPSAVRTAPRWTNQTVAPLAATSAMFVVMLLAGCGGTGPARVPTVPARGSISLQGQPLAGAFLALHPKAPPAAEAPTSTAVVQPDGTFAVTTYDAGDGAPVGDYVVTVQWRKAIKSGGEFVPGPNLLPAKYGQSATSDVVVHVAAGATDLPPIVLKR